MRRLFSNPALGQRFLACGRWNKAKPRPSREGIRARVGAVLVVGRGPSSGGAAARCRHCGGPLHRANYPRKPRGGLGAMACVVDQRLRGFVGLGRAASEVRSASAAGERPLSMLESVHQMQGPDPPLAKTMRAIARLLAAATTALPNATRFVRAAWGDLKSA